MLFRLELCVLCVGLLSNFASSIDFLNCGSENIDIDTVYVQGCLGSPCLLRRREPYNIIVTPNYLVPQIDHVDLDVKAVIRGARFHVEARTDQPCGLPCPLSNKLLNPQLPITVELGRSLLPGPAPLIVNVTYMNGHVKSSNFCIKFDIHIL